MGQLFAVEVIYRGVFQKTLAKNITRDIVLAAHNEGKLGISFGRYGDAPERNGIPAKSFAIVANDELTLEAGMAQYEPKQVDLTVVLDDTLCKGARVVGMVRTAAGTSRSETGAHPHRNFPGGRAHPVEEHSPSGRALQAGNHKGHYQLLRHVGL